MKRIKKKKKRKQANKCFVFILYTYAYNYAYNYAGDGFAALWFATRCRSFVSRHHAASLGLDQ